MITPLPAVFITPCLPSKATHPPSGSDWAHEVKHDGYRLMLCRDGDRVRCFTKNSHDWADRFPAIVEAALRISATSFLIDGEAAVLNDDGRSDFNALRSRSSEAVLLAFDLLEYNGNDLRGLPLSERKKRLGLLIGTTKRSRALQYVEHIKGDGPAVFRHVCSLGLEGIVSKRMDSPYRSGPSTIWLNSKNPASAAARREREEEWR